MIRRPPRSTRVRSSAASDVYKRQLVFLELGFDHRQGQRRADQRDVGLETQEVGDRADVVLVPVGEHDRLDIVQAILDVLEVGQDQVDSGVVVLGEENPAVNDQQPPCVFENCLL